MKESVSESVALNRPVGTASVIGILGMVFGVMLVAAATLADLRPNGASSGFGMMQAIAASIGMLTAVAGYDLRRGEALPWAQSIQAVRRVEAVSLLTIGVQLVLLVFVTSWYQLENPAFAKQIVPLAAIGFLLHHLAPARWRLTYFVWLSVTGLVMVLGWTNTAWLVAVTAAFAALCHLRATWAVRVATLVAAGTVLGVLRVRPDWVPFSPGIWPILGSILMFRLIVYAYDVRNSRERIPVTWSAAYFFMLPNVVFPLFPVVDFTAFRRTYYDREPFAIYQRGVEWMFRGLVHLLLYRAIYQHLTLAPSEVTTGAQLVRYMSATFLLYLRVSGTFHFIVGMLHLFGFRLPETHRFFYLASSFTDFWRRINIYWKDFMMKVVFYPVYFPLRKRGETTALVVGTLAVFGVTWLTHSYQWFWILGKWLLSWTDGLFWGVLGVLLIANSLWEARHGRKRVIPGAGKRRTRDALGAALKSVGVFATICTLWSFWGSPTIGDWLDLVTVQRFGVADWAAVLGVLALIFVAAFIGERTGRSQGDADRGAKAEKPWRRTALATAAGLAVLATTTSPVVTQRFGADAAQFMRDMRLPELNKRDAAALQRGYYENLQGVSLQNSQLWELYAQRPTEGQDIWQSGVLRERPDFLARDMRPMFGTFESGHSFRTNRWGMRDRDYALAKPAGTTRIALLGQSYVAGDGVSDGETFEEVAEDRLAAERGDSSVQILNFAVGSYSILQQLLILDERVWQFTPDAVLYVANPGDGERLAIHLVQQLRRGVQPPFEPLRDILRRANVTSDLRENEALSRLVPFRSEMLSWAEHELLERCRAHGVRAVWIYLSLPERGPEPATIQALVAQAKAAGLQAWDWSDVYDGHDLRTLQATPWDFHPNAAGHRLIADRFLRDLTADSGLLRPAASTPSVSLTREKSTK